VTTIATFTKPEDAHLLRMRLEASGVQAFIQDENMIRMDLLYSNAIGGVRVQIADEDVATVKEFLAEDSGIAAAADAPRCPKCGCTAIDSERFSKRFAYLSLLLFAFPLVLIRHRLRCASCLHTWKPSARRIGN
jgi:hypothetical protein